MTEWLLLYIVFLTGVQAQHTKLAAKYTATVHGDMIVLSQNGTAGGSVPCYQNFIAKIDFIIVGGAEKHLVQFIF